MQTGRHFLIAAAVFVALTLPAFGDKRTDTIDIILAVDKSLSMAEQQKMESVKRYVDTWLLDEVMIPGDTLVVIAFYGKADVIVSQKVRDDADKTRIKTLISQIRPNGRFTDIGNALDVMKSELGRLSSDGKKKFLLLMTDGIQEAPPSSKYYSKDGTFNHEFLANTKTIQKTGWKVQILGIGTDTAAKALAKELQGSFGEITETITPENLKAQTENLLGSLSLAGEASLGPIGPRGESTLTLSLKSEGYTKDIKVSLSGVDAKVNGRDLGNVLPSPREFVLKPSGATGVQVPLSFPRDVQPGGGSLSFSFGAGERFTPSEVSVRVATRGVVESYWWMGLVALAVLAAVALLVVLLARRAGGGGQLAFVLSVDEEPVPGGPFSVRRGGGLFLNEIDGAFSVISSRNARSVARLFGSAAGLGLEALKADRFPGLEGTAENVMGKSLVMRAENGKKRDLAIASALPQRPAPASAPSPKEPTGKSPAAPAARKRAPGSPAKKRRGSAGGAKSRG